MDTEVRRSMERITQHDLARLVELADKDKRGRSDRACGPG